MLYRLFSSLKTSVFILSFMCLVFLIGTIFPQGSNIDDYIKAGGKYVVLVKALNLLDIFVSPLFLFITGILLINLAVCLYDRLKLFLKSKRKPMDFEKLKTHPNVVTFENNPPSPPFIKRGIGGFDVEERLKGIGFKLKAETQSAEKPVVKIFEKGLQYWWLSWFYHVGIILAISGFFLTALFAFEKDVLLYPDKPEIISTYSKDTRWNRFLEGMGMKLSEKQKEDEYVLTLKEFRTEYYQGLRIDYPENKIERLVLGIGIKKVEPSKKGFSYMPKMWLTRLDVKKPDGEVLDAKLWVNKPFRTGGLTLYQMGYEQGIKLVVKMSLRGVPMHRDDETIPKDKIASPEPALSDKMRLLRYARNDREVVFSEQSIVVEARVPFQVGGIKGKFVLGPLKLGTLFKKDGTTERIIPVTTLYYMPEGTSSEKEELGELRLGGSIHAKNVTFEFRDYEEGSYLSYRKDPGVLLVGVACLFVFIGLFVRCFGAWYRVQYAMEDRTSYVLISTRGILADKDRIIKKLQKA